jgi:hypothetical protein
MALQSQLQTTTSEQNRKSLESDIISYFNDSEYNKYYNSLDEISKKQDSLFRSILTPDDELIIKTLDDDSNPINDDKIKILTDKMVTKKVLELFRPLTLQTASDRPDKPPKRKATTAIEQLTLYDKKKIREREAKNRLIKFIKMKQFNYKQLYEKQNKSFISNCWAYIKGSPTLQLLATGGVLVSVNLIIVPYIFSYGPWLYISNALDTKFLYDLLIFILEKINIIHPVDVFTLNRKHTLMMSEKDEKKEFTAEVKDKLLNFLFNSAEGQNENMPSSQLLDLNDDIRDLHAKYPLIVDFYASLREIVRTIQENAKTKIIDPQSSFDTPMNALIGIVKMLTSKGFYTHINALGLGIKGVIFIVKSQDDLFNGFNQTLLLKAFSKEIVESRPFISVTNDVTSSIINMSLAKLSTIQAPELLKGYLQSAGNNLIDVADTLINGVTTFLSEEVQELVTKIKTDFLRLPDEIVIYLSDVLTSVGIKINLGNINDPDFQAFNELKTQFLNKVKEYIKLETIYGWFEGMDMKGFFLKQLKTGVAAELRGNLIGIVNGYFEKINKPKEKERVLKDAETNMKEEIMKRIELRDKGFDDEDIEEILSSKGKSLKSRFKFIPDRKLKSFAKIIKKTSNPLLGLYTFVVSLGISDYFTWTSLLSLAGFVGGTSFYSKGLLSDYAIQNLFRDLPNGVISLSISNIVGFIIKGFLGSDQVLNQKLIVLKNKLINDMVHDINLLLSDVRNYLFIMIKNFSDESYVKKIVLFINELLQIKIFSIVLDCVSSCLLNPIFGTILNNLIPNPDLNIVKLISDPDVQKRFFIFFEMKTTSLFRRIKDTGSNLIKEFFDFFNPSVMLNKYVLPFLASENYIKSEELSDKTLVGNVFIINGERKLLVKDTIDPSNPIDSLMTMLDETEIVTTTKNKLNSKSTDPIDSHVFAYFKEEYITYASQKVLQTPNISLTLPDNLVDFSYHQTADFTEFLLNQLYKPENTYRKHYIFTLINNLREAQDRTTVESAKQLLFPLPQYQMGDKDLGEAFLTEIKNTFENIISPPPNTTSVSYIKKTYQKSELLLHEQPIRDINGNISDENKIIIFSPYYKHNLNFFALIDYITLWGKQRGTQLANYIRQWKVPYFDWEVGRWFVEFVEKFGGTGHLSASRFTVPLSDFFSIEKLIKLLSNKDELSISTEKLDIFEQLKKEILNDETSSYVKTQYEQLISIQKDNYQALLKGYKIQINTHKSFLYDDPTSTNDKPNMIPLHELDFNYIEFAKIIKSKLKLGLLNKTESVDFIKKHCMITHKCMDSNNNTIYLYEIKNPGSKLKIYLNAVTGEEIKCNNYIPIDVKDVENIFSRPECLLTLLDKIQNDKKEVIKLNLSGTDFVAKLKQIDFISEIIKVLEMTIPNIDFSTLKENKINFIKDQFTITHKCETNGIITYVNQSKTNPSEYFSMNGEKITCVTYDPLEEKDFDEIVEKHKLKTIYLQHLKIINQSDYLKVGFRSSFLHYFQTIFPKNKIKFYQALAERREEIEKSNVCKKQNTANTIKLFNGKLESNIRIDNIRKYFKDNDPDINEFINLDYELNNTRLQIEKVYDGIPYEIPDPSRKQKHSLETNPDEYKLETCEYLFDEIINPNYEKWDQLNRKIYDRYIKSLTEQRLVIFLDNISRLDNILFETNTEFFNKISKLFLEHQKEVINKPGFVSNPSAPIQSVIPPPSGSTGPSGGSTGGGGGAAYDQLTKPPVVGQSPAQKQNLAESIAVTTKESLEETLQEDLLNEVSAPVESENLSEEEDLSLMYKLAMMFSGIIDSLLNLLGGGTNTNFSQLGAVRVEGMENPPEGEEQITDLELCQRYSGKWASFGKDVKINDTHRKELENENISEEELRTKCRRPNLSNLYTFNVFETIAETIVAAINKLVGGGNYGACVAAICKGGVASCFFAAFFCVAYAAIVWAITTVISCSPYILGGIASDYFKKNIIKNSINDQTKDLGLLLAITMMIHNNESMSVGCSFICNLANFPCDATLSKKDLSDYLKKNYQEYGLERKDVQTDNVKNIFGYIDIGNSNSFTFVTLLEKLSFKDKIEEQQYNDFKKDYPTSTNYTKCNLFNTLKIKMLVRYFLEEKNITIFSEYFYCKIFGVPDVNSIQWYNITFNILTPIANLIADIVLEIIENNELKEIFLYETFGPRTREGSEQNVNLLRSLADTMFNNIIKINDPVEQKETIVNGVYNFLWELGTNIWSLLKSLVNYWILNNGTAQQNQTIPHPQYYIDFEKLSDTDKIKDHTVLSNMFTELTNDITIKAIPTLGTNPNQKYDLNDLKKFRNDNEQTLADSHPFALEILDFHIDYDSEFSKDYDNFIKSPSKLYFAKMDTKNIEQNNLKISKCNINETIKFIKGTFYCIPSFNNTYKIPPNVDKVDGTIVFQSFNDDGIKDINYRTIISNNIGDIRDNRNKQKVDTQKKFIELQKVAMKTIKKLFNDLPDDDNVVTQEHLDFYKYYLYFIVGEFSIGVIPSDPKRLETLTNKQIKKLITNSITFFNSNEISKKTDLLNVKYKNWLQINPVNDEDENKLIFAFNHFFIKPVEMVSKEKNFYFYKLLDKIRNDPATKISELDLTKLFFIDDFELNNFISIINENNPFRTKLISYLLDKLKDKFNTPLLESQYKFKDNILSYTPSVKINNSEIKLRDTSTVFSTVTCDDASKKLSLKNNKTDTTSITPEFFKKIIKLGYFIQINNGDFYLERIIPSMFKYYPTDHLEFEGSLPPILIIDDRDLINNLDLKNDDKEVNFIKNFYDIKKINGYYICILRADVLLYKQIFETVDINSLLTLIRTVYDYKIYSLDLIYGWDLGSFFKGLTMLPSTKFNNGNSFTVANFEASTGNKLKSDNFILSIMDKRFPYIVWDADTGTLQLNIDKKEFALI